MHQLHCSEVWGGIHNEDIDAQSAALATSLYSAACDGGKGGDIYYYSVCQMDKLTRIAVADVVGHGEKVSTVSQWIYEGLRKRMNGGEGCELLSELNLLACERGLEALTTASVASFYKPLSKLCFSYAGHPPLLFRQRATGCWRPLQLEPHRDGPANLPLGITAEARYEQRTVAIEGGDRLLFFTDGVLETPGRDGDLFGEERLLWLLESHGEQDLHEIKEVILDALREFSGGPLRHDDVTLLAVEVRD